jgi:hypothetical protein
VGLHPRLLEQPPVDGELPLDRIRGLGQGDVVLDRPALGVLGVHRLVQRDAEAAQDRPPRERACRDLGTRAEEHFGVEVDGAGVDLDVPRIRQPGADQRPHRVQALQDRRPVVGQVLVDRVEPPALRGSAVQLLHEHRRPACGGRAHEVTARG